MVTLRISFFFVALLFISSVNTEHQSESFDKIENQETLQAFKDVLDDSVAASRFLNKGEKTIALKSKNLQYVALSITLMLVAILIFGFVYNRKKSNLKAIISETMSEKAEIEEISNVKRIMKCFKRKGDSETDIRDRLSRNIREIKIREQEMKEEEERRREWELMKIKMQCEFTHYGYFMM